MVYPDSDYPGGIDSFPDPDTTLDGTPLHSELHLSHNDAIEKIETENGITPSGSFTDVAARLGSFSPANAIFVGTDAVGTAVSAGVLEPLNVAELFDPRGWHSGNTPTVTPDRAGWYLCVGYSSLTTATTVITRRRTLIIAGGVQVPRTLVTSAAGTTSSTWGQETSGVVQLNGTTDTVQVAADFSESSGTGSRSMLGALSVYLLSPT